MSTTTHSHCGQTPTPVLRLTFKILLCFTGIGGILYAILIPTYRCKQCKLWFWKKPDQDVHTPDTIETFKIIKLLSIIALIALTLWIIFATTVGVISTLSDV